MIRIVKMRLVILGCLIPLMAACAPGRTVEAVGLLRDLADPPAPGEALAGVTRQSLSAPDGRLADLYSGEDARAALLVVPGAAEAGHRDPRLVALAAALARAEFLVMVPQRAGAEPLRVSAADAESVADSILWLTDIAGVPAVGLVGISYAAGPAVLAALRPEAREHVAFLVMIGGYHDITAAITYMTTGFYRTGPEAPWRAGPVNRRAKWLFLKANADRVAAGDTDALRAIAARRLADPQAPVARLVDRLGPEGRAVWRLLSNDDPARVPALIAALPESLRQEIAALDLAIRDLGPLRADLLLIHGRDDPMVPYTESRDLARRVGPDQADLHIVVGLAHVDLGALGAGDIVTLIRAAYDLLSARDAAPAPAGS